MVAANKKSEDEPRGPVRVLVLRSGAIGDFVVTLPVLQWLRLVEPRGVIDLAAYLGAMVNIGRLRGQLKFLGDVSDPWPAAVERLRGVITYAADKDVKITMEPINRYETDFIFSAADGMRQVEDLDCDNFGLMLDLFHMNIEDVSIEGGLRQAGDRLWHVHIADSNRRYPGSGHLNFDRIFATLNEMGYEGYISAELLPLPDPDTAAQETSEFLRAYLA